MIKLKKAIGFVAATCGLGLAFKLACLWNTEARKQRTRRHPVGNAVRLDEVIESFAEYIRAESPNHFKSFRDRLNADREAAMAEAVVFGILQQLQLNPRIADKPGIGGCDFLCEYQPNRINRDGSFQIIVEATTLEPNAIAMNSGWPNQVSPEPPVRMFNQLTKRIEDRLKKKVPQLSRYPMPRVLAIVSSHVGAGVLLSDQSAVERVLCSFESISQSPDEGEARPNRDFCESAFLKRDPQTNGIEVMRPTISAILLISVAGDVSSVLGALHPQPHYSLDIRAFPGIHLAKFKHWPVGSDGIELEWVVGQPPDRKFGHQAILRADRSSQKPVAMEANESRASQDSSVQ